MRFFKELILVFTSGIFVSLLAINQFPADSQIPVGSVEEGRVRITIPGRGSRSGERGTQLYDSYLIEPFQGNTVRIRCLNEEGYTLRRVPSTSSAVSDLCPDDIPGSSNNRDPLDSLLLPSVGGVDDSVPYIISPRQTFIFQEELGGDGITLSWNHVNGAESYTVKILGDETSVDLGTVTVTDQNLVNLLGVTQVKVTYPLEQFRELNRRVVYIPVIISNRGTSSNQECAFSTAQFNYNAAAGELPCPIIEIHQLNGGNPHLVFEGSSASDDVRGWGFKILSEQKSQELREDIQELQAKIASDRIQGQPWSEESQTGAYVRLYTKYELFSEAIQMLEKLAKDSDGTATIHISLGDLYGHVGLNRLAEASYNKALDIARQQGEVGLLEQAIAYAALSQLHKVMGNSENAASYAGQAEQVCRAISNSSQQNNGCAYPLINARLGVI